MEESNLKYLKKAQDRAPESLEKLRKDVEAIVANVAENGDEALKSYNEAFDGCKRRALRVSGAEIEAAYAGLDEREIADIRAAAANIGRFAREQRRTVADLPLPTFKPSPGVRLGHRVIPARSCCCYVPGGNYPLYSSALMLAIPAKVAGVPRVAACSPAMRGTDRINPRTRDAWEHNGEVILADSIDEAIANDRAPEHLEVQTRAAEIRLESEDLGA